MDVKFSCNISILFKSEVSLMSQKKHTDTSCRVGPLPNVHTMILVEAHAGILVEAYATILVEAHALILVVAHMVALADVIEMAVVFPEHCWRGDLSLYSVFPQVEQFQY